MEIRRADAGTDEEVGGIEQQAAGLNGERPELEPMAWSVVNPRWNVEDGCEAKEKQVEAGRIVAAPQRHAIDRVDQPGGEPVQQARGQVEGQQHPDEPERPARPRAGSDGLPPERCESELGLMSQRDGVVRYRYDGESGDAEGQSEPKQPIPKKYLRRFMAKARPDE